MEEDQEIKHVCKLCNKTFPCGRSLGGHMRSHVINSAETDENPKKNNGGSNSFIDNGYGLRENPKKTSRFVNSKEDTLLHGKLCKECGKGFQSWKALFGHMKCHSEKASNSTVEEDSWTSANNHSQSDNETGAPNRRKRSLRRFKRYFATTTTSSSFTIVNVSPSVSEIEHEQEEVAKCLMLLSKDVGGFNFVGESSDNNSEFLEARSSNRTNQFSNKIEGKDSICNGGEVMKFKKLRNGKLESTILDDENLKSGDRISEFGAAGISRNGFHGNGKFKKSKEDEEFEIEASQVELGKNWIKESEIEQAEFGSKKCNSSKRRKGLDLMDSELGVDYEKKSKFECGTCNKAFHSYQALGGHRASHKKLKGCFASKIDGSENNIDTNPNPTADTTKLIKSCSSNINFPIDHGMVAEKTETSNGAKKNKGSHKCPICFRVFSSGQALGGHKRSHLIVSSEAKGNQSATILTQKPIPEIRNFLDLNMPAPVEEESSTDRVGFKPWWVGSNHKHEPLVGLISN